MRQLSVLLSVLATLVVAVGVFRVSHGYFQSEETLKAQGRLAVYQGSVVTELERFAHLTHVLARDAAVIEAVQGGAVIPVSAKLEDFALKAGIESIYLIGADGKTIAASNYRLENSFVGQNYAFRPYFQQALAGQQGRFYAIGATTGLPGYFIADGVRDGQGIVVGVIAIKIGFPLLEQSWQNSGEHVLLANEDGVVLLTSDPAWRYRVLAPLTQQQRSRIEQARQFPAQPLAPLEWETLPDQRARIGGETRIHLTAEVPPHGWGLHYFASDAQALARAWLVTAVVVFAAATALILYQVRRARRVGAALARSEREEAALRKANAQLAIEIEDRRTAERRLKRTQDELERASRLAALGQLAASVTHELGQPIAAMRNHLVATEIGGTGPAPLVRKIGDLVERMEGITRQLKFFATSDAEPFSEVNLHDALQTSLALLEPNLAASGTQVQTKAPDTPVLVRGSRLRIEQVMTNLLRNAIDASDDSSPPRVQIRLGGSPTEAWFEIEDNGHGLGKAALADLQEPFVTTRASGQGMGLGLAISASIVKDHHGTMTARNSDTGGAVFRVVLPTLTTDENTA
jgi:two-component system C4-dicarboxylate transport sensor histidine kinase DctB